MSIFLHLKKQMKIELCLLPLINANVDHIFTTRFDVCNVAYFATGADSDLIVNLKYIYKSDRIQFNRVNQLTKWPDGRAIQFVERGMFESYADSDLVVFARVNKQRNCLHSAPGDGEAPRGVVVRSGQLRIGSGRKRERKSERECQATVDTPTFMSQLRS